jgi:hypothetical protein
MCQFCLRACRPRAYKPTTVPGEERTDSPDKIGGDFAADPLG